MEKEGDGRWLIFVLLIKTFLVDTLQPLSYYYIFDYAIGNENLFIEDENCRFFLQKYDFHINAVAETMAYCLTPDHFHLLIEVKSEEQLVAAFPI